MYFLAFLRETYDEGGINNEDGPLPWFSSERDKGLEAAGRLMVSAWLPCNVNLSFVSKHQEAVRAESRESDIQVGKCCYDRRAFE